jgi:uncharacterized protein
MSNTALAYRLSDIESAGVQAHAPLSQERLKEALGDLGADVPRCSATLDAQLSKQKQTVLCSGQLRGSLTLPCQRCLEAAKVEVDAPLHTVFTPAPGDVDVTDAADDADDVDYAHHDGETVDLWPTVREQLILAVPMSVLCKEDCRGLCPSCGVDRNTTSCDCQPAPPLSAFSALRGVKL